MLQDRRTYLVPFFACALSACTAAPPEELVAPVTPQDSKTAYLEENTIALPDTAYSRNVRIYKHVRALDASVMEQAEKTPDSLRFPVSADPRLANFEEGDVLVSSHDKGLFRTIVFVERQPSHVFVQTRQARLSEALAQGSLHFAKMAQDELRVRRQALGFDGEVDKKWDDLVSINHDFKDSANAKLQALGIPKGVSFTSLKGDVKVGAEIAADYDVEVGWGDISVDAGFTAKTHGTATFDAQLEVNTEEAQFHFEKEMFLFSTAAANNPLVVIPGPDPLTLNLPLFPLTVNFQAHTKLKVMTTLENGDQGDMPFIASGGVTLRADLTAGLTGGLGNRVWGVDASVNPSITPNGPNFTGQKNFRARAQFVTSASLEIGEGLSSAAFVTPLDATIHITQLINADTQYCPNEIWVEAKGVAEISKTTLGVDLPIIGRKEFTILDRTRKTLYDKQLLGARSQLDIPGICDPNAPPPAGSDSGDGQTPGVFYTGKRSACDADSDGACGSEDLACFEASCVTDGSLRVSLAWFNSEADLDLLVERPDGTIVGWDGRGDVQSGRYDFHSLDFTGVRFAGRAEVENFFALAPASGTYTIYVGRDASLGLTSTPFRVQAFVEGREVLNSGGNMETAKGQYEVRDRATYNNLPSFQVVVP